MSRKVSKSEASFNSKRTGITEEQFKLELLYAQQIKIDKLEKIRSNISKIVWVIAIMLILSILGVLLQYR
ncbi:hypothetical protein FF125_17370 [Aureibaculum algae]|uniref:Uncharacterized protein n=1 Tax=Aureibaculum algae TaxID=2584122 RepID=A0A5B7TTI7_9FLAO|nr:hypothetical protein [Aureibaculum algae]QCX40129.1 hypothetical protein FF125_17370 [Aureibaculum algae]